MVNTIEKISRIKVIPIITIHQLKNVVPTIQALIKGGLPVAEITFRTEVAGEAIRIAAREFPNILLGAGTILTPDQADQAAANGATFMVTPGFNPRVVDHCLNNNITIIPGLNTPTHIEQALERGITHVKFFPAEASGGISFINAIAGPFGIIRFMATGGINDSNLKQYLSNPCIFACGGSWMVKNDLIENDRYEEITRLAKEAVRMVNEL